MTLVDVLARRAAETPARLAYAYLEHGEDATGITDSELAARAEDVAAQLLAAGVRPGDRVLLAFPTGLALVVALYGCLRAGAAAVPVAPPSSKRAGEATAKIVRDCDAAAAVIDASLFTSWMRHVGHDEHASLQVIPFAELDVRCDSRAPTFPVPDDLAVLQYTSGSTSRPKGAMIRHRALLANNESVRVSFEHDASSTFVGWLPYFHDMGLVGSIAQPMYVGATSYLMSPLDFVRSPVKWLRAIDRYDGRTSGGPNFGYELCATQVREDEKRGLDLSRWRLAFCGAEPVRARTIGRFSDAFATCGFARDAFFPCYGLAENTVFVSGGPTRRAPRVTDLVQDGVTRRIVSCGLPGRGVTVRIVSPGDGSVLPEGSVGEIWVGGSSKSDAYFGDPVRSAEKLNAHTDACEGPFLRTGDLGFLSGGELHIAGRLSEMIVVRGRNVFPQDVEAAAKDALAERGELRAAAFGVDDGERELLVLVQELAGRPLASDLEAAAHAVRRAVFDELEITLDRMVFVKRGRIPATTSGKTRRGECRKLLLDGKLQAVGDFSVVAAVDPNAAPPSAIDSEVLAIAAEVLGTPLLPSHLSDAPVALGMDSIRIALLAFRLETRFGPVLPLAELAAISLRDISARVRESNAEIGVHPGDVAVSGAEVEPSIGQSVFAHLHALGGAHRRHTIAFAVRVPKGIAPSQLRDALETVCRAHAQLRLRGTPAGVVAGDSLPVALARYDCDDEARRAARAIADIPLALDADPLTHFKIECGAGATYLVVRLHHYVADLWSVDVLLHDLSRTLQAKPLEAFGEYSEFVRRQHAYLASEEGRAALARWIKRLAGRADVLDLPVDRPRPAQQSRDAGILRFVLDDAVGAQLFTFADELRCTPFAVLASAYTALLARHAACRDVVVGVPVFGRPSARFERTVGLFTNTLPMRFGVAPNVTFRRLVEDVHRESLACLDDQHVPLGTIAASADVRRTRGAAPLFQAMLTVQSAPLYAGAGLLAVALGETSSSVDLDGHAFTLDYVPPHAVEVDLDLAVVAKAPTVSGYLAYNVDVFSGETAARMLDGLCTLLAAGLAEPDMAVDLLPAYPAAYAEHAMRAWSRGPLASQPGGRVEQLFIEQAERQPHATAVVHGDESHEYAALRGSAARLAECLRETFVR